MKKSRKFLAGLMAVIMAMGSSMAVSAADIVSTDSGKNASGLTGTGALEGAVVTDVVKVVLPTVSLNFSIDPQGLMPRADARKFTNLTDNATVTFKQDGSSLDKETKGSASGCIFFTTTTADKNDVKKISAVVYSDDLSLTVENKSSCKVFVKPLIKVVNPTTSGVNVVSDVSTEGTAPAISMKLTYGSNTAYAESVAVATAPATGSGIGKSVEMNGISDAYEYKYAGGKYTYTLNEDSYKELSPVTQEFKITGDCNDVAAWSTKTAFKPTLSVTWEVSLTNNDAPTQAPAQE